MELFADQLLKKSNEKNSNKITITEATKGTLFGAGIGVVGGLLYAKFRNKDYFISGFLGMIVGGTISKIFI